MRAVFPSSLPKGGLAGELGLGVLESGQVTRLVTGHSDGPLGYVGTGGARGQEEFLEPDPIVSIGIVFPPVLAAGFLASEGAGRDERAGQGQVLQLKLVPIIIDVHGAPLGELLAAGGELLLGLAEPGFVPPDPQVMPCHFPELLFDALQGGRTDGPTSTAQQFE